MSTLSFLLLISFSAQSQKLTGIWRGYFSSPNGPYREETYKYEIQIAQQANNSLKGVTYSYKTTVFYGKAELTGIYSSASKNIILKETKLVDLKISDKSEPCLMTCYLDYTKIGKLEVLEGNFISINAKDKGDCGSGKVYLERVQTSDFKKEDFLLKKNPADSTRTLSSLNNTTRPVVKTPTTSTLKNNNDNTTSKPGVNIPSAKRTSPATAAKKPAVVQKKTVAPGKPITTAQAPAKGISKTPVKEDKPKQGTASSANVKVQADPVIPKKEEATVQTPQLEIRKIPVPKVLLERENNLVRTINTSEENILIELYDNGTIDNDTVSVYHNNELVIKDGKLSYSPLTVKIKCTRAESRHEIVLVAENLGDIPPNSALMVVKAGKERYEVFLYSNETRNAKVVINYIPKN